MSELDLATRFAVRKVCSSVTSHPDRILPGDIKPTTDILVLFFKPLLALRMLFLECVTLCFGTAHRIGGKSSARASSKGRAGKYHGALRLAA
jgi:hypothetical protein